MPDHESAGLATHPPTGAPGAARDWEAILAAWFGEPGEDAAVAARQARLWWSKDPATDQALRQRFEPLLQRAAAGQIAGWPDTPRGRLAKVILFDQLPRNLYRGSPEAFAFDPLARQTAEVALAAGDESRLRPIERAFLYMPFEHGEDMAHQDLAVARFAALCAEVPSGARNAFQGFLDFARHHREIIGRFGRFPHRNALLGRPSTPEEDAFLREPGSSF